MDKVEGREKATRGTAAMISAGVVVTGDVECATDLQIAGRVQGDVRCSTVFVDEGGAVTGGIHAERVRVSGAVEGTVEAGDLAIEPGGRVSGTITYARLKVSAGGVVEGNFTHRAGAAPVAVPAAPENGLKLVEPVEPVNPRRVYVD